MYNLLKKLFYDLEICTNFAEKIVQCAVVVYVQVYYMVWSVQMILSTSGSNGIAWKILLNFLRGARKAFAFVVCNVVRR